MPAALENGGRVLLIDDQDLADVRKLLIKLSISFECGDDSAALERENETALLITNSRHGVALRRGRAGTWRPAGFHIIVHDEVSRTLRGALERSGCDFVVQSPIHPEAFSLLVNHALYTGPERRQLNRAAMAATVKVHIGLRGRGATLIQLSTRGAGLLTKFDLECGAYIDITLPKQLTAGRAITLNTRVINVQPSLVDGPRSRHVSLGFRSLDPALRRELHDVMQRHAFGASALSPRPAKSRCAEPSPTPEPVEEPTDAQPPVEAQPAKSSGDGLPVAERRLNPRKPYTRHVLATGAGESHALIGSDLSIGGMRVRPDVGIELGMELKLAVYGSAGVPPVLVRAVVARDDGEDGLLLRFEDVPANVLASLERLVDSFPDGYCVGGGGPDVVVSKVLEKI